MRRSKTEGGQRCPGGANGGRTEAAAAATAPPDGAGQCHGGPSAEAGTVTPPPGYVTVEPGVFRPKGAFGPLVDANGDVVVSKDPGWPHLISGLDERTLEQRAYTEQVKQEAEELGQETDEDDEDDESW